MVTKPRLGSQQLTIEDWEAWALVQMRFAQVHHSQRFSFDPDRRDALLMWRAQNWPALTIVLMEQEGKSVTYAECIDARGGSKDPEWPF